MSSDSSAADSSAVANVETARPAAPADLYKVYRGLVWAENPKSDAYKEWVISAINTLNAESRLFKNNHNTADLDKVINSLYARSEARSSIPALALDSAQAEAMSELFGQGPAGYTFATVFPVELPGYQKVPLGYMTQEDLAAIYSRLFRPAGTHPVPSPGDPEDVKSLHRAALTYLCAMKGGKDPLLARLEFANRLSELAGRAEKGFLITENQADWFVTLFIKRRDFQQIAPYPESENPHIPDGLSGGITTKTGY